MGFWFNNFVEFERKQKTTNKVIINFYYSPDNGEDARSVKVFLSQDVRVPTKFIFKDKINEFEDRLNEDPELNEYEFSKRQFGDFYVGELVLPNDPRILKKLKKSDFQKGNYDKLFRLGGFFPERRVFLGDILKEKFQENGDLELESLEGIDFGEFLTLDELSNLPSLCIDIEKPLWKKDDEKRKIDEREKLLKLERKYEKLKERTEEDEGDHRLRKERIGKLERELTIDVEDVGRVGLYEERFDSDISVVTTIWKSPGERIKELYILDPNNEFKELKKYKDYDILMFKSEVNLIDGLLDSLHKRRPAISYGHNQVYDITQLRFAAEKGKRTFDPVINDVKPKRDFVRNFLQRLRQDMIYFDTLWLANIFYPYLKQKRFGTNLKLGSVAQFRGIDFEKSQSHDDLRIVEAKRLAGKTPEIRKKAMEDLLYYSADDVDVTEKIIESMDFMPLLINLKRVLPSCTLTEIAFSPSCMDKLHEYLQFKKTGNFSYHGRSQNSRRHEIEIFKKRFPRAKKDMLDWAFEREGISKSEKGEYENVSEFYLPLEEWTRGLAFHVCPGLREVYEAVKDNQEPRFAFLQYLKRFEREIFTDYYFARREEKTFKFALEEMGINEEIAVSNFSSIERVIGRETLDNLKGSFRYLKENFRGIYVYLNGKGRSMIRPTSKKLEDLDFPYIMKNDADLYLLKERSEEIKEILTPSNQRVLKGFLTNFDKFEILAKQVGREISQRGCEDLVPFDLVYSYIQNRRAKARKYKFNAKYGFSVNLLRDIMAEGYQTFAKNLKNSGGRFLEARGDYIFVEGVTEIEGVHIVRELDSYVVD